MDSFEYVESLLNNYHEIKSDIDMLKFELECFNGITPEETIEALSFAGVQEERIQTSNISDKTGKVASIYRQVAEKLNVESEDEIRVRIVINELELARLEYCVKKLQEPVRSVMRDLYFEKVSLYDVCRKHFLSEKTINRYRKKGIGEIAAMFEKRRLVI